MTSARFVHILTTANTFYNQSIVKLINSNFNHREHLFVVRYESVYELTKCYGQNIVYEPKIISIGFSKLRAIAARSEVVFLHAMLFSLVELLTYGSDIARKTIWVTWGNDLYRTPQKRTEGTIIQKIKRLVYMALFRMIQIRKVQTFLGVGIGFDYDTIEIKKSYGSKMRVFKFPYPSNYSIKIVDEAISSGVESTAVKRIMVGHSAYQHLEHLRIINVLSRFKNENITVSVPLSYGNKEYAKEVAAKAVEVFGDKAEIISEFMQPYDYIKYLMSVDVAVFANKHQAALANVFLLLYLKKKVFLSVDGVVYQYLNQNGAKVYDFEDVNSVSYLDLFEHERTEEVSNGFEVAKYHLDESNSVQEWKRSIALLALKE